MGESSLLYKMQDKGVVINVNNRLGKTINVENTKMIKVQSANDGFCLMIRSMVAFGSSCGNTFFDELSTECSKHGSTLLSVGMNPSELDYQANLTWEQLLV